MSLTDPEKEILQLLALASEKFKELEEQHEADTIQFWFDVSNLERIIAVRASRRIEGTAPAEEEEKDIEGVGGSFGCEEEECPLMDILLSGNTDGNPLACARCGQKISFVDENWVPN